MELDSVTLITGENVPIPVIRPVLATLTEINNERPEYMAGLWIYAIDGFDIYPEVKNYLKGKELINSDGTVYSYIRHVIEAAVDIKWWDSDHIEVRVINPLPFPLEEL